ncbi:Protein phosphatase 1 regulatory subunit 15A, partial [Pseudolycoriella hygida]
VFENEEELIPSSVESTQSICDAKRSTFAKGRQQQISESSEDDFICFEDSGAGVCDDDDNDECDGAEDLDSESENEDDVMSSETAGTNAPDSGFEERKVRFNLIPVVHVLRTWTYAHKVARKGEWEQIGRDRVRFLDRIRRLEPVLLPVFESAHREKVYNERFHVNACDNEWQ